MNNFADLHNPNLIKYMDPELPNLLIKMHFYHFHQQVRTLEKSNFTSVKLLSIYVETLRNIIHILLAFTQTYKENIAANNKELIEHLNAISQGIRVILQFLTRLNHDVISQCTILTVIIDFNILNKDEDEVFGHFFKDSSSVTSIFSGKTYELSEDGMKTKRMSFIRALAIFKEKFDIFSEAKYLGTSSYDYILNLCEEPNANIKHYAFKSMQAVLDGVKTNDHRRDSFMKTDARYLELFELLLKNWEFPLK